MTTKAKLERVIRKLQEEAESENYHDLYSQYEMVAEIVTKHAGEEIALKVMQDIADRNGFMS